MCVQQGGVIGRNSPNALEIKQRACAVCSDFLLTTAVDVTNGAVRGLWIWETRNTYDVFCVDTGVRVFGRHRQNAEPPFLEAKPRGAPCCCCLVCDWSRFQNETRRAIQGLEPPPRKVGVRDSARDDAQFASRLLCRALRRAGERNARLQQHRFHEIRCI